MVAQQKPLEEQLVGTWTLVSSINTSVDGKKTDSFGPNAKGLSVFESNGRYSWIITASNLPNFASNNRNSGTADENKTAVQGSIAHFGTYSVSEANKSYTLAFEGSTFPNWTGTSQTRVLAISGDEMTINNPVGSSGGTIESKWKLVPATAAHLIP